MSQSKNPEARGVTIRIKEFFGYRPGDGMIQFRDEVNALTPADKQWFCDEFNKMGIPTELITPGT